MSIQRRALLIGMTGPGLQAIGLLWEVAHILVIHLHTPIAARHILFEPGFLLMFVGFVLSIVCVPVAIELARASEADVVIPVFGPAEARAPEMLEGLEGAEQADLS